MAIGPTKGGDVARAQTRLPGQVVVLGLAVVGACIFILVLDLLLDPGGRAAKFWLDLGDPAFPFPFTIQNAEHLLFFLVLN